MFTDNDIIPTVDIIDVYVDTAKENPEISIFSGKILPDISLPEWIDESYHRVRSALGIYDKGDVIVPILPQDVWGGNMVLRKNIFMQGYGFNVEVGPKGENYIMGSETELLLKLEASGYKALYIPNSKVYHQIRENQLSLSWLKSRAFRSGKGVAFNKEDSASMLFGVPRYLFKKAIYGVFSLAIPILKLNKKEINYAVMELYYNFGRIIQSYKNS